MSDITSFGQLMAYPKDGSRKTGISSGKIQFDFETGLVTFADNTTDRMSSSLATIGSNFARSLYVFVSDAEAKIKVGGQIIPSKTQCIFVINGLAFDRMEIFFPDSTVLPNRIPATDFAFQIVASDASVLPIGVDGLLTDHEPATQTGASVDAYTMTHLFYFKGYAQLNITIENTHGANGLTGDIQYSDDGTNWYDVQNFPVNIAFGTANIFGTATKHVYYRIQVKNQTVGFASSYKVSVTLER